MSNARKLDRPATRADLDALPETVVGEIIDGVLYTQSRPRSPHAYAEVAIGGDLRGPFDRGRGGPGGWWILVEPGIELPDAPEISPDVASWRRERMVTLPEGPLTVVPDWVCEILSTNRAYHQRIKRPFYARIGVPFMWLVDVEAKTVTASALESGRWVEVAVFGEDDHVARIPPFDAIELDVGSWWAQLVRRRRRLLAP